MPEKTIQQWREEPAFNLLSLDLPNGWQTRVSLREVIRGQGFMWSLYDGPDAAKRLAYGWVATQESAKQAALDAAERIVR
jgi:hypothetical protein